MSKVDASSKAFFSNPRNFADLINGIVFSGRATIDPKDLETVDTERINEEEGTSYYVDISKKWTINGTRLSIISIENQSYIDYGMVVRNMVTEAIKYRNQLDEIKAYHEHAKDVNGDEFLSKMTKSEMLVPIITVVVYWGEKPWDGPRQLYDLLDVDSCIEPFIYNYKLNLYDYHDSNTEIAFQGEVEKVIEALRARDSKIKTSQFIDKNKYMKMKTARFIGDILGIKNLEKHRINTLKGDMIYMCKAWDEQYNSGVLEGEERGIQIGEERGIQIGKERGLKVLVETLRVFLPNLESVYEAVTKNDIYKDVALEAVQKHYKQ